ncbi:MAG: hypothetical protein AAFR32_09185 [Pseudomonadota bacterium]
MAFYSGVYSVHQDLAGAALSARLASTLGAAFSNYSLYFPPAENVWFGLAAGLSDLTGLRLDLAVIFLTSLAVAFSTGLAFHIRRKTTGATPLFFVGSFAVMVLMPVLYKNMFGLREHMVLLGLWPYLILRISDPDNTQIGWRTRAILGLWMGVTLCLKYLYAIVVLVVEAADALARRRPDGLFRAENLISGAVVAGYLVAWLVLNPEEREAIRTLAGAIEANYATTGKTIMRVVTTLSIASFFIILSAMSRVPHRITLVGLALVLGSIAAAWIQLRWYAHHMFPITMALMAWVWILRDHMKPVWLIALLIPLGPGLLKYYNATAPYQETASEMQVSMKRSGISVSGKRIGILAMHPSPLNQLFAANGAIRWNSSMNNAYVATVLLEFDRPENSGERLPAFATNDEGILKLHDEMLRLWEDMPPDALILDRNSSWPLKHIDIKWTEVFAQDERFQAVLAQYDLVYQHKGEHVDFDYYVRAE